MKNILFITLLFISSTLFGQSDSIDAKRSIIDFQNELNEDYSNPAKSPLGPKALKRFKGHAYFSIDLRYRVSAMLTVTEDEGFFKMKTSTDRLPLYGKYGELTFSLDGKEYKLSVYQSSDLMSREGYKDYLFLPFKDLTNGDLTYAGGRYLELRAPSTGEEVIIDFNKAYNPYCAYSNRYSCPLVPSENHLNVKIPSGVKMSKKK